jgi:hypothetical protein
MRGSLRAGGAALVLAGLLALIALLSAVDSSSAGHRDGPRERLVKCRYSPDTQTLSVRLKPPDLSGLRRALRRLPAALREEILGIAFPSSAALDVRIGQITVLEGEDLLYGGSGGLIRCAGGPPTVTNTDTVVVRAGKRVAEGYLFLDFRYGLLTPGATDEGDGSSEIELEVDLDGGEVFGRMTRGPDQVSMDFVDGRTAVNLNAGESVDDTDLRVGARDAFFVQGAGSGDQLYVDQTSPKTKFFQAIDGGQGEDLVQGGSGPDAISCLPTAAAIRSTAARAGTLSSCTASAMSFAIASASRAGTTSTSRSGARRRRRPRSPEPRSSRRSCGARQSASDSPWLRATQRRIAPSRLGD